jgi:hypothetical protein
VEFVKEGGKTVLKPMREQVPSFREYVGILPYFKSREEINAWIHDLRGDDEPAAE